MLSGPELARLVKEFEEEYLENDNEDPKSFQHHEQGLSTQRAFHKHVASLTETIKTWWLLTAELAKTNLSYRQYGLGRTQERSNTLSV